MFMARRPTYEELEGRIAELEDKLAQRSDIHRTTPTDPGTCVAAFMSSPDNMVISRIHDGIIMDVSDTFLETSGYARDEIVGRSVIDIGIWADRDERKLFINLLRECGEARCFLAHFTMKDGRTLPFEISGRQIEINGEACIVSISRDVSEIKRQEAELRKQVGTLDSIFRAAPTGIGMVRERVIVAANQRLCDMLGYSSDELMNQAARMLYPTQEESDWVGKEKYEQISRKGTGTVETRWVRKDGRIIDVLLSSTPIDLADLSVGVTFTALDITERKAGERKLALQTSYLTTLHETALGLVGHLELDDVLDAIVQNAVALISGADGAIFIHDDESNEMVAKAATGRLAESLIGFRFKMGAGLAGRSAQTGRPIIVEDYQNWPGRSNHPVFKELRAALSVPIMSRDKILGTIGMSCFSGDKQFQSEEVDILSHFADLAAIALDNAHLYSQVQVELRDKQRVEAALRASEQHYRSVFENTGTGTVLSEQDTTLSMVNQGFADLVGYTLEEIEGRIKWTELVDPADHARMLEIHHLRRKDPAAAPKSFECGLIGRNGLRKDVILKVDLIPGTTTSVGSFTDISRVKKAEQTLRKYEQMVTSSSDNMALIDREYTFQVVNGPYSEAVGRAVEDIIGRTAADIFGQELFERYQKPKIDQCLAGEELHFKAWYDTPGLGRRYIDTFYYPSREEDGTISGAVLVGRDMTDMRKLEGQLLQAQKMEAVGTLAGGVAHDFNNLLMGIQGRTSLMLSEIDRNHPFGEHLEGIESYVKSAVDLTRQILGFARGGKYEVQPTDLNELIKTQNRMFSRTRKEITIRGKYEKDLWTVEVDRGQIKQVLLNLYVNAWQAMPGGGDLFLSTENVSLAKSETDPLGIAPGRFVRVAVSDTGVGMDRPTMERIFEPFFTTREMGRGTGLGLASAYGIIKNHGGVINVYSEKGEGSSFSIYLPASSKSVEKEVTTPTRLKKGKGTLLLVDDEEMILDVGAAMLKKLGYTVHIAGNGDEALQFYQEQGETIDLVILDMVMPKMGGGEVFDRLKAIDSAVKVLLSSGYSINGKASEIIDRGCVGFIQKPFNLAQLSEKVQSVLAA
jgi:two-component system, cell cycle sensor histidine kinase and response regulator CckA